MGKSSQNIQNLPMTPKQEKCEQQRLVNNLEASPKAKIDQELKVQVVYLYWPNKISENPNWFSSHIWKTVGWLPPTKRGP